MTSTPDGRPGRSQRHRRHATVIAALLSAVAVAGCAPDEHDIYTVEAPPQTRAPLPTTTLPEPGAETVDGDGTTDDGDGAASSEPSAPATFPATGEVVEVRSLDNAFRVADVTVVAGTEVRWINGGRNDHNILPVDAIAELDAVAGFGVERDVFVPGAEYSYLFDTPGVYPYFCSIHGTQDVGMVGVVIVEAPA